MAVQAMISNYGCDTSYVDDPAMQTWMPWARGFPDAAWGADFSASNWHNVTFMQECRSYTVNHFWQMVSEKLYKSTCFINYLCLNKVVIDGKFDFVICIWLKKDLSRSVIHGVTLLNQNLRAHGLPFVIRILCVNEAYDDIFWGSRIPKPEHLHRDVKPLDDVVSEVSVMWNNVIETWLNSDTDDATSDDDIYDLFNGD